MVNPLLTPSPLPYALPDFAELKFEHYREALDAGMREQRAEVAAIIASAEPPSFENTVLALESSGRLLGNAAGVFYNAVSTCSDEQTRALDAEYSPILSAHGDQIMLNADLFARVAVVYDQVSAAEQTDAEQAGAASPPDAESIQLVKRTYSRFVRRGALLAAEAKAEVSEINQRISTLTTAFDANLLADRNALAVVFESADELDGLTEGELSACAQAASDRGLADAWVVALRNFSVHPFLARLTRRESRRRIYEATARVGTGVGKQSSAGSNEAIISELTALRARRAELLGYPNAASASMSDQTASNPGEVEKIIYPLAKPALENMFKEAELLQAEIDAAQAAAGEPTFELAPWDWSFYTELVRQREYQLDSAALRPWFEAETVLRNGVFWAATQLYGITLTERPELVGYHPDVRIFEVHDADGSPLALFLYDLYARESKHGGAWMNNLVDQSTLFNELPVVVNNHNVPKPAPGEPTLLTLDEATTLFHEFGHALHGMFSRVTYPSLSGCAVPRDFVEFPSQVNEMWLTWPEVIGHFAHHYRTGEALDPAIAERLRAAAKFNQGFATTEYLAAALLDQEWHKIAPGVRVDDVSEFERAALERVGLANPFVAPRYRSTYFAHVFAGGYDAGYYSYIWSEILDADTVEWFTDNGGLTRANGDHFRAELLSRGRSREPLDSYRAFRGRGPEIAPLLKRRGLAKE